MSHSSLTSSASSPRVYAVAGMSCKHCVVSVTDEVLAVDGVDGAAVHLDSGVLQVSGTNYSDEAVQAAVADAGYEVVS